ncbi:precorrin-3B C(17)-methyltransferase [Microaerobacter geothermalis]|uniref:precorrin-3B C(17)-methyltransferase n=1 Tax=Microaerobacter geothermalis TaxID=674972 RepID=UPI001F22024E|nr:precorrin-3B C(17)-methyltransferase [Microaerobacter geothermalis]MCF6095271.1 precorrin-3B C(17)-methyltransferase [Microaerobacter geothermalis]
MKGKLLVIGFGPGSSEHMTKRALDAINECDVIVGYKTYVDLIRELVTNQEIVSTGMTEEVSRAREAIRQAEAGKKVAVISSGDSGVYGMAGLIYEVLVEKGWNEESGVSVEIVPGISAINSCAALLGAPVMHDACTISLSDHLTPWDMIARRLEGAGMADFVVALYNPRSGRRTRQIVEAQKILLKYRSPDTPVGIVKSAYRKRQNVVITTLEDMLNHEIGMLTTVIVGNSSTFLYDGKMITPRGYQRKYTLNTDEQTLKPHERLRREAEPWGLGNDLGPRVLAEEALAAVNRGRRSESIFEIAVSPGVANKKLTPRQLAVLGEVAGDEGTIEYTPHHQVILRIPTDEPVKITERLAEEGLLLYPVGEVVVVKACDFCDGEKGEGIPYAEEISRRLGGLPVPKELRIGINGCGMACYGAVQEDIGIVYRKGGFDLFLGAKTVGRNAHSGFLVAEGIAPEEIVGLVGRIVCRYASEGYPNERFHKFFKRVQEIESFVWREVPNIAIEASVCGE